MPVLPTAPWNQPWVTNRKNGKTNAEPQVFVTIASPRFALRTPPTPSLAAEVEAETTPASSTTQKPSNEVIGGAFIGAFLGLLLLILLLRCCCGGGRNTSENGSVDSASTSPKDPPPLQPVYRVPPGPNNPTGGYAVTGASKSRPVSEYHASRPAQPSRETPQQSKTKTTIAKVEGTPAFVVRRVPQPRRPRRHSVAGLESVSSSSERHRRRSSRRGEGVQIIDLDVPRNFRAPAFGEMLREVKP